MRQPDFHAPRRTLATSIFEIPCIFRTSQFTQPFTGIEQRRLSTCQVANDRASCADKCPKCLHARVQFSSTADNREIVEPAIMTGRLRIPRCQFPGQYPAKVMAFLLGCRRGRQKLGEKVMMPKLPPRAPDGHKGDYGRVLVIGGSRGMSGASVLCGSAALRVGAGLVRVAVPRDILPIVAAGNPCYMTASLSQDDDGRLDAAAASDLRRLAAESDVVALGPGLGRSADLDRLVVDLVRHVQRPMVVDADALNALAQDVTALKAHAGPVLITPHPGEFARLLGTTIASVQESRRECAARFAAEHGVIVVLKGRGTVVSDGRQFYENTTGNPAMATGGTGDVLTGVIAALLGQGLEPFAAAQLGVYVHGLAGDLARDQLGIGLMASDLLDFLPQALRRS